MNDEPFAVVCPSCEARAVVARPGDGPAEVACGACGFQRRQDEDARLRYGMQRIYAGAVDPYFGLALWEVDGGEHP